MGTDPIFLICEDRGGVRVLTLNRPEKRNALNTALTQQLLDALRVHRLAERHQLEGRLASGLAHQVRHHDRGHDAVLRLGIAERGAFGHHRHVARDGEPRAAAHRRAVDRGHHGL